MPTTCNRGFYGRSYCLLNIFGYHYAHHQELKIIIQWLPPVVFRAVVFQVAGLVWSWGLCVRFAGCCMLKHVANRKQMLYNKLLFYFTAILFYWHSQNVGEKRWQTTPKNVPRMQCTRAVPVAWLGSGSCPNWPKGWILIIIITQNVVRRHHYYYYYYHYHHHHCLLYAG